MTAEVNISDRGLTGLLRNGRLPSSFTMAPQTLIMDKGQPRESACSSAELWMEGEQVAALKANVTRSGYGQVLPPHRPVPYLTLQGTVACGLPGSPVLLAPAASSNYRTGISDKVPTGNSTPRRS